MSIGGAGISPVTIPLIVAIISAGKIKAVPVLVGTDQGETGIVTRKKGVLS